MIIRTLLILIALCLGTASAAQPLRENAIAVSLAAESDTPAPGQRVTIAIRMTPDPGWHGYWANPGDAGVPDRWHWTLPPGFAIGEIRYPTPDPLIIGGIMNYVYEHDYALLVDLGVPASARPGDRVRISVQGDWLACTDEICVPERGTYAIDLVVGDGALARQSAFDGWRRALPRPLGSEARFAVAGDRLRLAIPYPAGAAIEDAYFFPLTDGAIDYSAPQQVGRAGDMVIVEASAGRSAAGTGTIEGVLKIGQGEGLSLVARPGDVPLATGPSGDAAGWRLILLSLGGAILGGVLLNIMPCVFPILSLKALSLAKAGGDEGAARRDALAYTIGAVAMCLALGGALLGLRASGMAAGWAFQLQQPMIVLALLLLVTAIALNLAGFFALPGIGAGDALTRSGGAAGSFWTGALAAFVATPCTGPFMAAALGAALVLPAAAALSIFGGLGFGMALPFLLLGFVPALRRRLPRPGPWMERFRRWMSVPMFLTAAALLWLIWRQSGMVGFAAGLVAAAVVGGALIYAGRAPASIGWLRFAVPLVLAIGAVGLWRAVPATAASTAPGALAAEPFSETRLSALRAEGRPVFVYFTADWCITCKVNEAAAIDRQAVADAFEAGNVAVLVGDWTTGDPAIGRFLESHGRSGVPLYLWYGAGAEAEILPQVLTPGTLTNLVGS